MSATDGRLYASTPVDFRGEFLAPGKELERALNFHPGEAVMEQREDSIVFKRGRSRITLKTLPTDRFPFVEQPDHWLDFTPEFFAALRRVRAFLSDNATQIWAMGVIVHEGGLAATNNIVLANVDFQGSPIQGIIPVWLIDYLSECPQACSSESHCIYLRWEDGTWLQSKRVEGECPPAMLHTLAQLPNFSREIWSIPAEWRTAYRDTLKFATRNIILEPGRICGSNDVSMIETEIDSPVERISGWDHQFLGPVLEEATHWKIEDGPNPCFWYGDGISGLVVGKRMG